MKAIAIASALVVSLALSGCANNVTAENSTSPTPLSSESAVESAEPDVQDETDANSSSPAQKEITSPPAAPKVEVGISTAKQTADQLTYLIEEEKLAQDVYSVMYELWGARVFGNILQSEESHQGQVLTVMQARKLPDVRSSELGAFKNAELQKLYDQLIAKGKISAQDAYEVGVAIEELDIADITDMLATAKDADVISVLETLRRGSENHLRAFNRQL